MTGLLCYQLRRAFSTLTARVWPARRSGEFTVGLFAIFNRTKSKSVSFAQQASTVSCEGVTGRLPHNFILHMFHHATYFFGSVFKNLAICFYDLLAKYC